MILANYSPDLLKTQIKTILNRRLPDGKYSAFFFGSRVTGRGDDRSDIDLGLEASHPISASARLQIQEDLDNLPTLYKIDFVDFASTSNQFSQIAKHTVEPL